MLFRSEVKGGQLQGNQVVLAGFDRPVHPDQLLALPGIKHAVQGAGAWEIESDSSGDIRPVIFRFAVENDLVLLTLQERQQNLESVFHQLTKAE